MSNLTFNRESSNLGGINELKFIFENQLAVPIEIIKGQASEFIANSEFIVPDIVLESSLFTEVKKGLNLFEYKYTGRVAKDEYSKLQDCIIFDSNRIIAIVKDNNGENRLLGQFGNCCELIISFDKGKNVADLNHYQIEIKWTSKNRAAVVVSEYITPAQLQLEGDDYLTLEV